MRNVSSITLFLADRYRIFLEHIKSDTQSYRVYESPLQIARELEEEMTECYITSVKQAIIDYILLDPNEQNRLHVTLPPQVIPSKTTFTILYAIMIHMLPFVPNISKP